MQIAYHLCRGYIQGRGYSGIAISARGSGAKIGFPTALPEVERTTGLTTIPSHRLTMAKGCIVKILLEPNPLTEENRRERLELPNGRCRKGTSRKRSKSKTSKQPTPQRQIRQLPLRLPSHQPHRWQLAALCTTAATTTTDQAGASATSAPIATIATSATSATRAHPSRPRRARAQVFAPFGCRERQQNVAAQANSKKKHKMDVAQVLQAIQFYMLTTRERV